MNAVRAFLLLLLATGGCADDRQRPPAQPTAPVPASAEGIAFELPPWFPPDDVPAFEAAVTTYIDDLEVHLGYRATAGLRVTMLDDVVAYDAATRDANHFWPRNTVGGKPVATGFLLHLAEILIADHRGQTLNTFTFTSAELAAVQSAWALPVTLATNHPDLFDF